MKPRKKNDIAPSVMHVFKGPTSTSVQSARECNIQLKHSSQQHCLLENFYFDTTLRRQSSVPKDKDDAPCRNISAQSCTTYMYIYLIFLMSTLQQWDKTQQINYLQLQNVSLTSQGNVNQLYHPTFFNPSLQLKFAQKYYLFLTTSHTASTPALLGY